MSVAAPERPTAAPPASPSPPAAAVTAAAAFLSTAAAAWMAAGLFRGLLALLATLGGAAIGAGGVWLSTRSHRPALVQVLVAPAAVAAGAALALPGAGAGPLRLVGEAIRAGGLAQPPIPFDGGWRLLTVCAFAFLAAAAAALALSTGRTKLAVAIPIPVFAGAALMHPAEGELVSGVAASILLAAALAVSFGADLATEGVASRTFETRRLGRSALAAGGLVVGLVVLSRAGFLFPEPASDPVIPPQKPEAQPPAADRLLFTVRADRPGPWRVGVLDVYDGEAWLMPPYDTRRFAVADPDVPGAEGLEVAAGVDRAVFTIAELEGRTVPATANPLSVDADAAVEVDPRTQTLRLRDGRATRGLRYTVESPLPPSGDALAEAPPPAGMEAFLEAPVAPNVVVTLLDEAPPNAWDRLQFVRNHFYENVIAAGAGDPVDIPPGRVVEMLEGAEATPFEITAAEAILARWAGVPSRVGYGFHAGDVSDGAYAVHPRHGATWLEVYFAGHGWVPVVGMPPRARSTLLEDTRRPDPAILPTDQLALVVYVPFEVERPGLLFEAVRWWVARLLPAAALGFLTVWWGLPAGAKALRRRRRRRWARTLSRRVAAAYAEMRDAAIDLHVGDRSLTPLGFLDTTSSDPEHAELAWLVTRALWGDLARDLREEDATAAEAMARSVRLRIRRGQTLVARFLATGARTSLREPYTTDVPNLWPGWADEGRLRDLLGLWRRLRPAHAGMLVVVVLLGFAACARGPSLPAGIEVGLPERIAPEQTNGFDLVREPEAEAVYGQAGERSLVADAHVYTIRRGEVIEGSLQVAAFAERGIGREEELRRGVLDTVGAGRFEITRVGGERVYLQRLPEQRILVWFPPGTTYVQLMVARRDFTEAEEVFADVLRHRRGDPPGDRAPLAPVFDPRRGATP